MNSIIKGETTKGKAIAVSVCLIFVMMLIFAFTGRTDTANAATAKFTLKYTVDSNVKLYTGSSVAKNNSKYNVGTVFTAKPNSGFVIKNITVNKTNKGPIKSYKPVTKDIVKGVVTLKIQSMRKPADSTVTVKRNSKIDGIWGGSLTSVYKDKTKGKSVVKYGASRRFNIMPASGYYLSHVLVDGKNVGRKTAVWITGNGSNHKIEAVFAKATLKIKVDPGHAGKYNKGAVAGYWESEMVWKLSNYLKPYLNKYPGIETTMTKGSLYADPGVYERGLKAKGNDLFLSIHSNSSDSSSTDYPLTIVSYSKRQLYNVAQPLGVALAKTVRTTMKTRQAHQVWVKKQSDGRDWYGVIRGSSDVGVPGIIIEHSFHSNPYRAAWLMKKSNLKKMAKKEALTVAEYYGLHKNGTITKPDTPNDLVAKPAKSQVKLSWKNSPVTGVQIYRSTNQNKGFVLVGTTSKTTFKNTKLKSGKQYYYKIRAYRCNGKTIVFSKLSNPVFATVK